MAAGFNRVNWDGLDADGDPLANGVYLYKVTAQGDGEKIAEIGKAVVIR
jgi:flagellar hook assembly protein FlgD